MASDVDIRDGLVTRLETIDGLKGYDHVPDSAYLPAAVVERRMTRFDSTMARGSDEFEYTVTVLVSYAVPRTAQEAMSAYMAGSGASSIKAAVEGGDTLGGAAHFARVASASQEEVREVGSVQALAVEFVVEVTA